MINSQTKPITKPDLFKNEHLYATVAQDPPHGALLLGVIKTLEVQLQKRGLLQKQKLDRFYPLWFLAETERNVYLWRHGHSLTNQADFEFWIDVDALIAKRLDQLEQTSEEIESMNAGLGYGVLDQDLAIKEREYLLTLSELIRKIQNHASALSHVGLMIEREISSTCRRRTRVVLPQ
ncbi:MAG: hypothetical protein GX589_07620 [Deltaproteobacteria bacterium]|nr:hypothetical protein [Deltaproteobacteria bacterium]